MGKLSANVKLSNVAVQTPSAKEICEATNTRYSRVFDDEDVDGGGPVMNCAVSSNVIVVTNDQSCPVCGLSGDMEFLKGHAPTHKRHSWKIVVVTTGDFRSRLEKVKADHKKDKFNVSRRNSDSGPAVKFTATLTGSRQDFLKKIAEPSCWELYDCATVGSRLKAMVTPINGLEATFEQLVEVVGFFSSGSKRGLTVKSTTRDTVDPVQLPHKGYLLTGLKPTSEAIPGSKPKLTPADFFDREKFKAAMKLQKDEVVEITISPTAYPMANDALTTIIVQKVANAGNDFNVVAVDGKALSLEVKWNPSVGQDGAPPWVKKWQVLKKLPAYATGSDVVKVKPSDAPQTYLAHATMANRKLSLVALLPANIARCHCPFCRKDLSRKSWLNHILAKHKTEVYEVSTFEVGAHYQDRLKTDNSSKEGGVRQFVIDVKGTVLDGKSNTLTLGNVAKAWRMEKLEDAPEPSQKGESSSHDEPEATDQGDVNAELDADEPIAEVESVPPEPIDHTEPEVNPPASEGGPSPMEIPLPRSELSKLEDYQPGELMNGKALVQRARAVVNVLGTGPVTIHSPSECTEPTAIKPKDGLNIALMHLPENPSHFIVASWDGQDQARLHYADSMQAKRQNEKRHHQTEAKIQELAAALKTDAVYEEHNYVTLARLREKDTRFVAACGCSVINTVIGLVIYNRYVPRLFTTPDEMKSLDAFQKRLAEIKAEQDEIKAMIPATNAQAQQEIAPSATALLGSHAAALAQGGLMGLERPARPDAPGRFMFKAIRTLDPQHPDRSCLPAAVLKGLSRDTRRQHFYALNRLMEAPATLDGLPLELGLVEWTLREREFHKWRWGTTLKQLASLAGAFKRLSQYAPGSPLPDIHLSRSSIWEDSMKAVRLQRAQEHPVQAKIVTLEQIRTILNNEKLPLCVKQQVLICWLVGGRLGDVLQLRREGILLNSTTSTDLKDGDVPLSIKFQRGKGVSANGKPYTIHTLLTTEFKHLLQPILEMASGWLWEFKSAWERKQQMTTVNKALKEVDPSLSSRSIRRGACQHLATMGFPVTDIMKLTNHSSEKMCLTYLNMGSADVVGAKKGLQLGLALSN